MELVKRGKQHILHRIPRRIDRNLGDEAHALAGRHHYLAFVRLQLAGQQPEHRGLARAVPAQKAHPLSLIHLEREPV